MMEIISSQIELITAPNKGNVAVRGGGRIGIKIMKIKTIFSSRIIISTVLERAMSLC
jgi:hypothetical protein